MADPKRQSGGGKVPVATPNIGSTNMASLEVALSGCIGARVRLTTTSPNPATVEGTLYTIDPITNLLALNTSPPPPTPLTTSTNLQPGDYRILPISRISNFTLLSLPPFTSEPQTFTNALPALNALDLRALKAREAAAVAKLHERENRRGKGVTKEAQELFDAFHKTLPARWEATSIVISDSVIIDSPYSINDCRRIEGVDGGEHALLRVRKVLAMEREKMDLKNSSSRMNSNAGAAGKRVAIPTPAVPSGGARKGG